MNDPETDQFINALMGEDEIGVVVRSHLFVEHALNEYLNRLIPFPKFIEPMTLDYFQKAHLAAAMGLKSDLLGPLKALGKIRNEFAHRMNSQLDLERVNNFYSTFSATEKQVHNESYEHTRKQQGLGARGKLKHRTPKEKYVLMVTTIRAALLAAVKELD